MHSNNEFIAQTLTHQLQQHGYGSEIRLWPERSRRQLALLLDNESCAETASAEEAALSEAALSEADVE